MHTFFQCLVVALLLQACSSSDYFYRVHPAESYHEECGYAFTCELSGKPNNIHGSTITVSLGIAADPKIIRAQNANADICKTVNDVDSLLLGFADAAETFKRLKPTNRFEYRYVMPTIKEGFKKRKKLILKIYFRGEKIPKTFILKFHEVQYESNVRWISGC